MNRRKTRQVDCGGVPIGGEAHISIQSMTNTDTRNAQATLDQIRMLSEAGCEIVRIAVPDMQAAEAVKTIKKTSPIPIVADIHFDYRLALAAMQNGADKIRINPGNIGDRDRVKQVADAAKQRRIPIRVGVNGGSLEKDILKKYGGITADGLAESAMRHVRLLEEMDFKDIVISVKSSDVVLNYEAHMRIAAQSDYPLHIGVTEAGSLANGRMKSAMGIGALLLAGVGDTLRVSLTGDPVHEVTAAREILGFAGLRKDGINLIACPTCGRCDVKLSEIVADIEERIGHLHNRPQGITVAVMGCEVNGPGEAKEADIGMAFGKGKALLFQKGEIVKTVPAQDAVRAFMEEIENV